MFQTAQTCRKGAGLAAAVQLFQRHTQRSCVRQRGRRFRRGYRRLADDFRTAIQRFDDCLFTHVYRRSLIGGVVSMGVRPFGNSATSAQVSVVASCRIVGQYSTGSTIVQWPTVLRSSVLLMIRQGVLLRRNSLRYRRRLRSRCFNISRVRIWTRGVSRLERYISECLRNGNRPSPVACI